MSSSRDTHARVLRLAPAVSGLAGGDYGRLPRELSRTELPGCLVLTDERRGLEAPASYCSVLGDHVAGVGDALNRCHGAQWGGCAA